MSTVWATTLQSLGDALFGPQRGFLNQARLDGILNDTALISVPNDYTKDVLETKVRELVTAALADGLGREVRISTVDPSFVSARSCAYFRASAAVLNEASGLSNPDSFTSHCPYVPGATQKIAAPF